MKHLLKPIKKRKGDSGDGEEPSKRNKRSDVMNYLREKKEEENALKNRELNVRETEARNVSEQQQQMQKMFNAFMQQEQQQNNMMMRVINNVNEQSVVRYFTLWHLYLFLCSK